MWEKIGDLPLHPLIVHAPVVFVPLLALLGVAYAVIPPWRRYMAWAVLALAVAAPVSATAAVLSGRELELVLGETSATNRHQNFAEITWTLSIVLGVAVFVLGAMEWMKGRITAGTGGALALRISFVVVSIAVIAVGIAAVYYIVRAGDSGADMVWSGVLS